MSKQKANIEVRREQAAPAPAHATGWPPLASLRTAIDRLFDEFGTDLFRRPLSRRVHSLIPAVESWALAPAIEVVDCDDTYRITAELPGMTAENIDIKLSDGSLTIRGEKSEEKKEEKENYLLSERRYGTFSRTLPLPSGVNSEHIDAHLSNGVLTVTLPKTAEAKQKERRIQVKAA